MASLTPVVREGAGQWVLLSYRLPREPSTPRITIWRKLKRLGVAQISDGLVALPADARAAEYAAVLTQAGQAQALPDNERQRIMRRLRAELRRIHRRDYFPPAARSAAEAAVNALHPAHHQEEETA